MTTIPNTPAQPAPQQPAANPVASELSSYQTKNGGAPENVEPVPSTPPQEGSPPQSPPAPQDPDEPEPKWKGRFSDLSKQARQAEIQAAEERGRRLALEEAMRQGFGQPQPAQPQPAPAEAPDPEPMSANYKGGDFDPQYQKDWARWDHRQQMKEMRAELRRESETQQRETAERTELQRGFAQLQDAIGVCEQYANDLPEAASTLRMLTLTPPQHGGVGLPAPLADLISGDDNPHLIAHLLSTRPDLMQQIRRDVGQGPQGHYRIAAMIGAVSDYFRSIAPAQPASAPQSPPPQPSNSAPVIPGVASIPPPVNGAGASSTFNAEAGSFADFDRQADQIIARRSPRFNQFNR